MESRPKKYRFARDVLKKVEKKRQAKSTFSLEIVKTQSFFNISGLVAAWAGPGQK